MNTLIMAALLLCLGCGLLQAKFFMTQPQAIQSAFVGSTPVMRKTLFLTKAQIQQIEQLAQTKMDGSIVTYYVGQSTAGITGYAFFDRSIVRTMPVTYMVVVKPSGEIDHVDILDFEEPDDYLPRPEWLKLYPGRVLNNDLRIGHGIPHVTGASLTSQTLNDGIRRLLAVYQVAVQGGRS